MKRRRSPDEEGTGRVTVDFDQAFEAVRAWVCTQGGTVNGVAAASDGTRRVVANHDLAQGTTIFRIPDACLLHGIRHDELKRLPSLKTDTGDLSLALSILAELRRGGDSQFAAYIAILPGFELTDSLPAWWPDDELDALLGGSELLNAARRVREAAQHDAKVLRDAKLLADEEEDRLLFWALACVTSRAFEAGEHGNVMVPLLDLLDHCRPREVAYEYLPLLPHEAGCQNRTAGKGTDTNKASRGGFEVTALQHLEKGAEVHDTYGAKSGSTASPRVFIVSS